MQVSRHRHSVCVDPHCFDNAIRPKEEQFRRQRGGDNSFETTIESNIEVHEQVNIGVLPAQLHEFLKNPHQLGAEDSVPVQVGSVKPGVFGASQVGLLGKLMGLLFPRSLNDVKSRTLSDAVAAAQCTGNLMGIATMS